MEKTQPTQPKGASTRPSHTGEKGVFARLKSLIADDCRGTVLIETALVLPILIMMLVGILTYGMWLMTANSLQQVANEAARSTLGSLSSTERATRMNQAIANSLAQTRLVNPTDVAISSQATGAYFTVTLSYNARNHALFTAPLVPLPADMIIRRATVETGAL